MYALIQCGMIDRDRYATLEEAQREADRLNAEIEEELRYEIVGDGAYSVTEVEV